MCNVQKMRILRIVWKESEYEIEVSVGMSYPFSAQTSVKKRINDNKEKKKQWSSRGTSLLLVETENGFVLISPSFNENDSDQSLEDSRQTLHVRLQVDDHHQQPCPEPEMHQFQIECLSRSLSLTTFESTKIHPHSFNSNRFTSICFSLTPRQASSIKTVR